MKDGKYLKKYRKEMKEIMKSINPDWDDDFLDKNIMEYMKETIQNPEVNLDNNFTGENRDSTLLSVFDWAFDRKPIIAGNGTFYKNQYEAMNPIAKMLEGFLTERKRFKKLMFKEEPGSWKYADYDRKQLNQKILANSYYGASGAKSSAFYCQWGSPCTTGSAQSVISTCEQLFEGFVADNYIYLNLTEVIEWCRKVLKEFNRDDSSPIDDFIQLHSIYDVKERLLSKILNTEKDDDIILENFLSQYSDDELAILYYKNNLKDFIDDHEIIQDLFISIFENVENLEYAEDTDDWMKVIPDKYFDDFRSGKTYEDWNSFVNNHYFMDPNDVPDTISDILQVLNDYVIRYVYCRYLSFDRIYRLKNFERKTVTIIDTDSNIMSLDTIVNFIFDTVVKGESFGRTKRYNMFIVVNTLAFILTNAVTDELLTYGEYSNIPEEFRPIYNMKNEFLNNLTQRKYRVLEQIEGNLKLLELREQFYSLQILNNIRNSIMAMGNSKGIVTSL